ncbi:unnamed protein product [Vitrella brassicaformis CCMP3155]|uniref:C3H1-type domain-containing protein n=2 Tax=Vitrella brassicaformis TaxID=1169539 RepID=A0A0G4EUA2_VITBC|nr:unnamed protein product [Vitrella brassicaformis CCMP3155]|eukprot:CEM02002.1 unnamed protein product [Vitrella brassicaformis CCMP3155]
MSREREREVRPGRGLPVKAERPQTMTEAELMRFRTKTCRHWRSQCCDYGNQCVFAHSSCWPRRPPLAPSRPSTPPSDQSPDHPSQQTSGSRNAPKCLRYLPILCPEAIFSCAPVPFIRPATSTSSVISQKGGTSGGDSVSTRSSFPSVRDGITTEDAPTAAWRHHPRDDSLSILRKSFTDSGLPDVGETDGETTHPHPVSFMSSHQSHHHKAARLSASEEGGGGAIGVALTSRTGEEVCRASCSRGSTCPFAHSTEEVVYHPVFYKTRVCVDHQEGQCSNHFCPYVHGEQEQRRPPKYLFTHHHATLRYTNFPGVEFTSTSHSQPPPLPPPGLDHPADSDETACGQILVAAVGYEPDRDLQTDAHHPLPMDPPDPPDPPATHTNTTTNGNASLSQAMATARSRGRTRGRGGNGNGGTRWLRLVAGSAVEVQQRDVTGWIYGRCLSGPMLGQSGWFPQVILHLTDLSHTSPLPSPPTSPMPPAIPQTATGAGAPPAARQTSAPVTSFHNTSSMTTKSAGTLKGVGIGHDGAVYELRPDGNDRMALFVHRPDDTHGPTRIHIHPPSSPPAMPSQPPQKTTMRPPASKQGAYMASPSPPPPPPRHPPSFSARRQQKQMSTVSGSTLSSGLVVPPVAPRPSRSMDVLPSVSLITGGAPVMSPICPPPSSPQLGVGGNGGGDTLTQEELSALHAVPHEPHAVCIKSPPPAATSTDTLPAIHIPRLRVLTPRSPNASPLPSPTGHREALGKDGLGQGRRKVARALLSVPGSQSGWGTARTLGSASASTHSPASSFASRSGTDSIGFRSHSREDLTSSLMWSGASPQPSPVPSLPLPPNSPHTVPMAVPPHSPLPLFRGPVHPHMQPPPYDHDPSVADADISMDQHGGPHMQAFPSPAPVAVNTPTNPNPWLMHTTSPPLLPPLHPPAFRFPFPIDLGQAITMDHHQQHGSTADDEHGGMMAAAAAVAAAAAADREGRGRFPVRLVDDQRAEGEGA